MNLESKLEQVLYGSPDVIDRLCSQLLESKVAICEQTLRFNLTQLLTELTERQRDLVTQVLDILSRHIPRIERESGQVEPSTIWEVLIDIDPDLDKAENRQVTQQLVRAISNALPMSELIKDPEGGEQDDEELIGQLQQVPDIPRRRTYGHVRDIPPTKQELRKPDRRVPTAVRRQQQALRKHGIPSERIPDYTTGQR